MSYDFHLFPPQPGVDLLVTARGATDEETEEINTGPPVPAKEARKQSIAAALMKANPALKPFQYSFKDLAGLQSITVEEAKIRFRDIELNGPENSNGIQIALFDDSASLTVPYWHKDKKAKAVFSEIWEYLNVMQRVAGYQIYDPQLDCIIDLVTHLAIATKCYTDVVGKVW